MKVLSCWIMQLGWRINTLLCKTQHILRKLLLSPSEERWQNRCVSLISGFKRTPRFICIMLPIISIYIYSTNIYHWQQYGQSQYIFFLLGTLKPKAPISGWFSSSQWRAGATLGYITTFLTPWAVQNVCAFLRPINLTIHYIQFLLVIFVGVKYT